MKRLCTRCNLIREPHEFQPSHSKIGCCRECQAQIDKGRFNPKLQAEVDEFKLKTGCVQCGYKSNAKALQFDHLDPRTKSNKVSFYVQRGRIEQTWTEIAKCQVLCANCHSIKSFNERNHGAA